MTRKTKRILTPVMMTLALAACEKQPASSPTASNTPAASGANTGTTGRSTGWSTHQSAEYDGGNRKELLVP